MNTGEKGRHPSIRQVAVQRFSVISSMSFERVVAMIEAAVSHRNEFSDCRFLRLRRRAGVLLNPMNYQEVSHVQESEACK